MTRPTTTDALPLDQRALLAFREAVRKVIEERRREGLPAYIWSNGKVVDALARQPRRRTRRARPGSGSLH